MISPWLRTFLALALAVLPSSAAANETFQLWEGTPPLPVANDKPEAEMPLDPKQHQDIVRLANVSVPTLTVYHPPAGKRNGTAVLICPGGGYHILAMKHEGTQVADWLNSLGITAAVLKYRVPAAPEGAPHVRPLLDGQRAMSLMRARAESWQVDPKRIGVLGFSAGGHLAAWMLCEGNRRASDYPGTAKGGDSRPDFGILIYPAYLSKPESKRPAPTIRDDEKPGPVFFVHASNDQLGPENSIEFYLAMKRAGVNGELHVYQQGGHGFGMLGQGHPINGWPRVCEDWLRAQKFVP